MQKAVQTAAYRYLIDGSSNRVQLTAIDNITAETFQSEWTDLPQINATTIWAAFKKENSHLQYSIQRAEGAMEIFISVNYDFLPKITQQFLLHLVDSKESESKIQYAQICQELQQLGELYESTTRQKIQCFYNKINDTQSIRIGQGPKLIEVSGTLTAVEEYYNEDCYDSYSFKAEIIDVAIFEGEGKEEVKLSQQTFPMGVSSQGGYESPFKFTFLTNLKKGGSIKIISTTQKLTLGRDNIVTVTSL